MIEFIIDLFRKKDVQKVMLEGEREPMPADFNKAERNLVHVSMKAVLSKKRVTVRTLKAVSENPKYTRYDRRVKLYMKKVQDEIIIDCTHFLDMLHSYCIDRKGNGAESEVFFLLLASDMTRYMLEQTEPGQKMKNMKDACQKLYERADKKSEKLHYCSPTKMSKDLHHANFVNEFMNDTSQALKICEASVLRAQATIHTCDDDTFVEASHLMELIKENCAIWKGQDPTKINDGDFD